MSDAAISSEIEAIHENVRSLLKDKVPDGKIVEHLSALGHEPYYIETVIENIREEGEDRKSFRNSLIMGGCYLIGGSALNAISYLSATNVGAGFFYLFWGVMVLGVVTIVRGFILYR
ncbi:hypothetical protein [Paraflavitalea pollutisoli]|uniref:hypothetical protein n=1 Tax=Paraflavitalea pollutisoli TaxID=3034143 RepID=UPI0023ED4444|nr:hypothetical protein [Paraflavitalea sp. H1-2-19X]